MMEEHLLTRMTGGSTLKNKGLSPGYALQNIQKEMVWQRFMGVLVKTIHAAKAENKDPKLEIKKRLMNYRNTPHSATGKAPAELVFRQTVKTKTITKPPFDPNPYTVVEVNGTQAVLDRDGKRKKQSFNKIKFVKDNKEKRKI